MMTLVSASVILSGLGHGALALAAGLLARALIRPGGSAGPFNVLNVTYLGLAAATVKAAGSVLSAFSEASAAAGISRSLRRRAVASFARHGLVDAAPRVLAMVAVRLREVERAVVHGAIAGARSVAQLAPILVGLIFLSPPLAAAGVFVLLPFALGLSALRRRWRLAAGRAQSTAEELHAGVDELVRNLDLWRAYGATPRLGRVIDETAERAASADARAEAARAGLSSMNEVLGALGLVAVAAIAGRAGWSLDDGTLMAFAAMCFMTYRPLRDLGDAGAWLERGALALNALRPLYEPGTCAAVTEAAATDLAVTEAAATDLAVTEAAATDLAVTDPACAASRLPAGQPAAAPRRFAMARLEFCRLGAEERGPRTSAVIEAGEILAVVGPTGSGKSTLLRVLLGLEPASGRLVYGGEDLTHAPVGPVHRPLAWVPQDAPLVTGTVLENVALLSSDERARSALGTIGARGLVDSGIVGPGGRDLSGGERRLVAIARAMSSELPVLLVDEPCAGLDASARARVRAALRSLGGKRSLVIVTHEEDIAAIADRVVRIGEDEKGGWESRATPDGPLPRRAGNPLQSGKCRIQSQN